MNKLVIFIGLLFIPIITFAQADSFYVSNKWCARKDTLLLFNSSNNIIQVYCKGMKASEYKLKSLDKALRISTPEIKHDTLSVMAMPYPAKGKRMRLAILNSKTSRVIKTVEFTSDSVPELVARLGNITGNEAPKKTILEQTVLKLDFPNSLYNYPYRIRSYTFKAQAAKGVSTIVVNGIWLTNAVIKDIAAAPEGSIIEFTNIQVTCPQCITRTLKDLIIKIK